MKTILVTGGAGYIGSHTVQLLIKKGYNVIVVDNLSKGHKWAIFEENNFYNVDLANLQDLEKVFYNNKIDGVIHFAAFIESGESMIDPQKYFYNNTMNTLNLLKAMLNNNVKNIIFSSTAAVYGEPINLPINEEHQKIPTNNYGLSKKMIELVLESYNKAYGLNFISLRYFNAAGASSDCKIGELHYPETHLIPLILDVAIGKKEKINVFGDNYSTHDGSCIRDYIHVEDLSDAHILALEKIFHNEINMDYINLGTGKGLSVFDIIKETEKITGKTIKYSIVGRREGDPAELVADNSKAKIRLGWEPTRSNINNIIKTAYNWHIKVNK